MLLPQLPSLLFNAWITPLSNQIMFFTLFWHYKKLKERPHCFIFHHGMSLLDYGKLHNRPCLFSCQPFNLGNNIFITIKSKQFFCSWHACKIWNNTNPLSSHQSQYFCQIMKRIMLTDKQCIFLFHFITNFGLNNV